MIPPPAKTPPPPADEPWVSPVHTTDWQRPDYDGAYGGAGLYVADGPVDFDDGPPVDYDDDRQLGIGAAAANVAAQLAAGKGRIDPASLAIEGLTDDERAGFLAALDEDRPSPAEVTVHAAPQTYAGEASPPPPPPLVGHRPRVADLPCPKCGSTNVLLRWHRAGHDLQLSRRHCGLTGGVGEHFHRECGRCRADWVTTDMLDTEDAR